MKIEQSGYSRLVIPVGPVHPAIAEAPLRFVFEVEGEEVKNMDVQIGYNHRGIEFLAQRRTYNQVVYLVERICGICSHSHPFAYVQAVENLLDLEVPRRGRYIRMLIGELERIHSHLLWAGVAGYEIGYDTLLMYTWRDREHVMDLLELLTGNRVNYAMHRIGGARRDIKGEKVNTAKAKLEILKGAVEKYKKIFLSDTRIAERAKGVGVLTKSDAIKLGAVGPNARASGVNEDIRRSDPHAAYDEVEFDVITYDTGDVVAEVVVRLLELEQSIRIIEQGLKNIPKGLIAAPYDEFPDGGEGIGRYEAPRGEVIHYVRSNGTDYPERIRVRAPTMANIPSYRPKLIGCQIADIPIIVASIDPCLTCTDRVTLIDPSGRSRVVDKEELRILAKRKYFGGV
jgi:Ni,Fe-hydrogenase III large subunit